MESYFEKMDYKKGAVLFVIFGVLLIAFLVFSIFGKSPNDQSVALNPTPTSNPYALNPSPVSTGGTVNSQMKTYSGNGLTFQYPSSWTVSQTTIQGGGNDMLVEPITASSQNEKMEMQITNTSPQIPIQIYTMQNYPKSITSIGNISATKFTVKGNPNAVGWTIIFSKNNTTYKIIESYSSPKDDPAIDTIFHEIEKSIGIQ